MSAGSTSAPLCPITIPDLENAVRSVFKVLSHHIDPGQVRKVRDALPEEVRVLWPDPDARH